MTHRYLLDTNILTAIAKDPRGPVTTKIAAVGEATVCTSIIVACEVQYGLAKRQLPRLTMQMNSILEGLDILDLPGGVAARYGQIRSYLESVGEPIGPNDLLIAAHAQTLGLTVVTRNAREFRRVPGLRVENWTSG